MMAQERAEKPSIETHSEHNQLDSLRLLFFRCVELRYFFRSRTTFGVTCTNKENHESGTTDSTPPA